MGRGLVGLGVAATSFSRRLFWPAVSTAAMLTLTLGLGTWQVQRLHWKQGLLADIDRGEQAEAAPLNANPLPFQRVAVVGRFLPGTARYGTEVRSGPLGATLGSQVLTPLALPAGDPVIVDRGWAPAQDDPATPDGQVRVEGYVREPEYPVRFGASDDPDRRIFYALDPAAIGRSLGLGRVAPFTLVVLGPAGGLPEPATALPRPPNDHLSYALTWFGLSLALMVIFAVYVRQTIRQGPPA